MKTTRKPAKKIVKKDTRKPMPVKIVSESPSVSGYKGPRSATIEKADGGYIVRGGWDKPSAVAKTLDEAQKHLKKIVG